MTNREAKFLLEEFYGKGCMFKKAGIVKRLEHTGINIKGYKKFVSEKKYKIKKIKNLENTLTYHHLKHRSDGGITDIENGAVVNELAHRYIHSLPRNQEELINNMLRQYKHSIDVKGGVIVPTEKGIEFVDPFVIDVGHILSEEDYVEIALEDNTVEQERKFNRAKQKQETLRLIDEELYGCNDDEDWLEDDFDR